MAKKFASSLSRAEYEQARAFERAGLCSISKAVKAFARRDADQIAAWRAQLAAKQSQNVQP